VTARETPPWLAELRQEIITRLRAQKSTQAALAAYVGITPKHVNQMLKGHISGTPEMLGAMAAAVGLRITTAETGEPWPKLPKRRPRGSALIAEAILERQEACAEHPDGSGPASCAVCERNRTLAFAASVAGGLGAS
jgi:transcriptional regulator with XRE-family HTH domain